MRHVLLVLFGFVQLIATAQSGSPDTLVARMARLRALSARLDTLTCEEVWSDSVMPTTDRMADALMDVLSIPMLTDGALDSLLGMDLFCGMARSADGRLRIFSWSEKTGGTFKSMSNLIFYRTAGRTGTMWAPSEMDTVLCGIGAGYHQIHLLQKSDTSALYVCIGGVGGCGTCCADVISVIELTTTGINGHYPAFLVNEEDRPSEGANVRDGSMPCMTLDTRCGDRLDFTYDPKKRSFRYAYMTDDLTPVTAEEPRKVTGTITWNGTYFVVK